MPITFHAPSNVFHLQGAKSSYVMKVIHGYLVHIHWGASIDPSATNLNEIVNIGVESAHPAPGQRLGFVQLKERSSFHPNPVPEAKELSLDTLQQEFPQFGTSDFRHPSYQAQLQDGTRITELVYDSHVIIQGKPALEGLPSTYVEAPDEASTLIITLVDHYSGLQAHLSYTVFHNRDAIVRSVRYTNASTSGSSITLLKAASSSLDIASQRFQIISLPGDHERERHLTRVPLMPGTHRLESRRGSSSHTMNPFAALVRPETTESSGEAFGFSFVYSGNFAIEIEAEAFGTTRVTVGLNEFDFSWELAEGASFQTPEVVMVYSSEGLGAMSRTYHELYRTRLCRGIHRDTVRPILVNNWEATYFGFTEDKIRSIADHAADLGIELFVLDDGWFGHRDNDDSSLGDWFVHQAKLPAGLGSLAQYVNDQGLQFGLWFEPEMVSPDSDLYRLHPDWCLHVPGRRRTEARNQLILDLSREDVQEYLFTTLSGVLNSANISYVKWDMNRNFSEVGSALLPPSRQKEVSHRYMLGLYAVLERLVRAFPHILWESCSGGGGRFDPGMLYYMPQTWTSDNTDAIERLKIQYGTSIVYPLSSMGAHVSAIPNHQTHRNTSLKTRGDVAMSGNFGYELDLSLFNDEDKEIVKQQVRDYKEIRSLVQQGSFYRLLSPYEGNDTAWMIVSADQSEAVVFFFRTMAEPNYRLRRLQLQGLNANYSYQFAGAAAGADSIAYRGDLLMNFGWAVPQLRGDYASTWFKLVRV